VGVMRWLVALAMPALIVLLWVRVIWNPWFVTWEYSKPDFPPDQYGFTNQQRIEYILQWINYYNGNQSPEEGAKFFSQLRLPGSDQPVYTQYDIQHMIDVRVVLDSAWRVLAVSAVIVIVGLLALLIPKATRRDGYAAIFMGGLITTLLLVGIILFLALSWRTFFITFHEVLFPEGGWTFDLTSTLIRIFPDRFWFDGFSLGVGVPLATGGIVTLIGWLLGRHARRKEAHGASGKNLGTA
jgi:integral membrane protein (TIGR01906 family)